MIFFVIYAAAVWSGAYFLRRRPMGFVLAALSPVPVALFTWLLLRWLRETQTTPTHVLVVFPIAYGLVITAGAWIGASARRLPRVACAVCSYDLEGNVSGVCPECGAVQAARRARARESTMESPSTSAAPTPATSAASPQ